MREQSGKETNSYLWYENKNISRLDILKYAHKQLDVDPRSDDDASPMSSYIYIYIYIYRCMLRPTWMIMHG